MKKCVSYFQDYFEVPYVLPEINLVTIEDFDQTITSSLGLILVEQSRVFIDTEKYLAYQEMAHIIGYSIARQWVGNLTSIDKWTSEWVFHGLSAFLALNFVDTLDLKNKKTWIQFFQNTQSQVLELESLKTDLISDVNLTRKSTCVIRMLFSYIGSHHFKVGVNLLLKTFALLCAKPEDFWKSLSKVSDKPVEEIMWSWTQNKGFPLVKVEEKPCPEENKRLLCLTQRRFLADGSTDNDESLWKIPVTVCTPNRPVFSILFDTKSKDLVLEGLSKNSWVIVNSGFFGLYRCLYDRNLLDNLISGIRDGTIVPIDRLGVLNDVFAASQAGYIPLVQVFKLLDSAYKKESDYFVWKNIIKFLEEINYYLKNSGRVSESFKSFVNNLLRGALTHLGWEHLERERSCLR